MRAAPPVLHPEEEIGDGAEPDARRPLRRVAGGRRGRPVGHGRRAPIWSSAATSTVIRQTLAEFLGGSYPGEPPDAEHLPHVHPDHSLSLALERMGSTGLNALPVVSRGNVRELMGIVLLDDILGAYGVGKRMQRDGPEGMTGLTP